MEIVPKEEWTHFSNLLVLGTVGEPAWPESLFVRPVHSEMV